MLCVPLSDAVLQVGGSPRPLAEEPVVQVPDIPKVKLGSMGEQLKDPTTQTFLRASVGNDQDTEVSNAGAVVTSDSTHADHGEDTEVSNAGAVVTSDSTHTDHGEEDMWEYEKNHDDGAVLTGTNPLENRTLQSLMMDADNEDEGDGSYEQEPEIPEEWVDPTNGTDQWAYEKAHDDGTELHGTNPLEAAGFVWEQDSLTDEEEHHDQTNAGAHAADDFAHPEEADDSTPPGSEVALAAHADEVDGISESEEEYDDGTVQYGTDALEHEDDEEDDADYDPPDHTDAEEAAMYGNSTHEEEEDDGTVLYGTNPLESDDEEQEVPSDAEVQPGSEMKALPASDATEA